MNTTTLTTKGQIVIPKEIRDHFGLKTSDKLTFSVHEDKIIIKKAPDPRDFQGMIKTNIVGTDDDFKKVIEDSVVAKYKRKLK